MPGFDDWGVWSILDLRANDCAWHSGPYGIMVRKAVDMARMLTIYELEVDYHGHVEYGEVVVDREVLHDQEMLRNRIEQEIQLLAKQAVSHRPKVKENKAAVYRVLLAAARRWAA